MLEAFLNRMTHTLPEKYKAAFKRDFYTSLYLNGSRNKIFRILYLVIFIMLMGASFVAVMNGSRALWFPLVVFLILLVLYFVKTLQWTRIQTNYMWKNEVVIPKRYNTIALVLALLLFASIIYILYLYAYNY